ncbi:MAG: hypothetical protein ACR2J8_10160 [Thermomicrobiales bacterium]
MASKRRINRARERLRTDRAVAHAAAVLRQCGGKRAYESREAAERAARALGARAAAPMRAYRCPHCSTAAIPLWHVAHDR